MWMITISLIQYDVQLIIQNNFGIRLLGFEGILMLQFTITKQLKIILIQTYPIYSLFKVLFRKSNPSNKS